MKLSHFSVLALVLLLLFAETGVCFGDDKNVITWDDLTLGKKLMQAGGFGDGKYVITWDDLRLGKKLMQAGGFGDDKNKNVITWDDLTLGNKLMQGGGRVIVVDPNGRGDSVTVNGAVAMVPDNNQERVKIHILPGIYREKVLVPATKPYISFIGNLENQAQTVITGNSKASDPDGSGGTVGTYRSATVAVEADYFCAAGITFENTIVEPSTGGQGYQAVALRISADKSVFYKVSFLGSQDTLLDDSGSHYFYQCYIRGGTDFIFGQARSLYQGCTISVESYGYAIAAHHRETANEDTGYSFVNCTITGNNTHVYLGRAWGDYSRITYSFCNLDLNLAPGGWNDWGIPSREKTAVFGEYQCTGKGADRTGRVPWSKALSSAEAKPFLDTNFIDGQQWLRL